MIITSKHVLICRTDNIGDVVLTLPITAWLKKKIPSIKISFLCRGYGASIVRACKTVDEVVEVENVASDLVSYFKGADIDTIIFAQPDRMLVKAAFKARIRNRVGNARQKLYQLIFCNQRVRFSKRISPLHEAQFNFEYLRPFGLQEIPSLIEIAALYDFKKPQAEFTKKFFAPGTFNVVIHAKSNGHGREWPVSHFEALAEQLKTYSYIRFWVTGSTAEGQWLAQNSGRLFQLSNVTNVCGKFSLDQLIEFIRAADGLIASGTGPLHVSAAVGQRTLGLFPPTRPMHPGRWAPVGERAQTLTRSTGCEGCAKKTLITCACMESIAPESVAKIVLQWAQEGNFLQQSTAQFKTSVTASELPFPETPS